MLFNETEWPAMVAGRRSYGKCRVEFDAGQGGFGGATVYSPLQAFSAVHLASCTGRIPVSPPNFHRFFPKTPRLRWSLGDAGFNQLFQRLIVLLVGLSIMETLWIWT